MPVISSVKINMNPEQKKLVKRWLINIITFFSMLLLFILPQEYWLLGFSLFSIIPLLLFPALFPQWKKWEGYGPKQLKLIDYVEETYIVKLWLVTYCSTILPILIYKMYTAEETNYYLYAISFFLLVFPTLVYSEIEKFKYLGENF